MVERTNGLSLRTAAIVAGASLLVMFVASIMATDVTIQALIVDGDAAATTRNIIESEMTFRIGIVSWLVVLVCDVLAAWGLYLYFRPANADLSLLAAWMRLVYASILGTAVLNLSQVLVLIRGHSHETALGSQQLQAQVLASMEAFDSIWWFGLTVFGIHVLLLGYLVITSGYTPRILGVILMVAFVGYLVINLGQLLLPTYETYETTIGTIFLVPMVVGEIGLGLWLLIRGVHVRSGNGAQVRGRL